MKVSAWKTIDLEVEVDVELDQVIQELAKKVDEGTPTFHRRLLESIAMMIRIMQSVPDDVIAAFSPSNREIIHQHLTVNAERFAARGQSDSLPSPVQPEA